MIRWLAIIGATAAVLASAPGAGAATPSPTGTASPASTAQQTLNVLNAQRSTNGIPAGITENTTWSNDCLMHDEYMAANGNVLTHTEVKGNPGYSAGGAFAGENSVLAEGTTWAAGNPYEHAPLHLDQLLAPRLDVLGSADADGFTCTTTFPGWTRPAPSSLTIYTYPGPGASIYAGETAREQPFTPGSLVGLTPGAKTGPNLIVFVDAPGQTATDNPATLSRVTLAGPSGTVPVVTADGDTAIPRSYSSSCPSLTLSCFMAPGGFIIPARPLQAGATYQVHVVVTFAGVQTGHTWTFTTEGIAPDSRLSLSGHELHFHSDSPAPIRVIFTRPNGQRAPSREIASGGHYRISLAPGTWQACGNQPAAGKYSSFQQCLTIIVTGVPKLRFGAPRARPRTVVFPLSYSSLLRGRMATLTITPLTLSCDATTRSCTVQDGTPTTRSITIRGRGVSVGLPALDHGVRLSLGTSAFQLGDAPWLAAHAVSRAFIHR